MDKPSYTSRRSLLNLIIGGTAGLALAPLRAASGQPTPVPEGLSAPENAEVMAILDGDTIALAGGDRLRLCGIEAPKRDLAPGDAAMVRWTETATAALDALVGGKPITLRLDAGQRDRYGRRLAQAFNSDGVWLQAALIGEGLARVHGDGRNRLGLRALLRIEAQARDAKAGIWRDRRFAVLAADDPNLGRRAGSFQIIAGQVFAAVVLGGTGFINFGADRHTDLTLVLKKPALDLLGPAMLDLGSLTSKPIRCRGWLDLYDGPRIDISHPEQIEVLET